MSSFLLLQKRNKKRARQTDTARLSEAAMFGSCTTVAAALVILLLGLNTSIIFEDYLIKIGE